MLSFKGLAFNLAYGLIGIFFAGLIQYQKAQGQNAHPDWQPDAIADFAFISSVSWFPWYAIAALSIVSIYCGIRMRKNSSNRENNEN